MENDIQFLNLRRNREASDYKIAGCLAFRINKHYISHTNKEKSNNKMENACLALAFSLKYLLEEKDFSKLDLTEVLYLLSNRHVNQETLVLAFSLIKI